MSWTTHEIVFCLQSPLHIGWRKVSNLQQTRPYVTGRVMWGALVARLTRENNPAPDVEHYERMQKEINDKLAFSYFFPAIALKDNTQLASSKQWLPIHNYGVCLPSVNEIDSALFSYLFLDSYPSTALDYDRLGAEQGSLHEVEYIRPRTRPLRGTLLQGRTGDLDADELGAQVYLFGYIFEREDSTLLGKNIKSLLDKLQLGGERRYGWGRIKMEAPSKEGKNKFQQDKKIFMYPVNQSRWPPELKILKGSHTLAHAFATSFDDNEQNPPITHQPITELKGFIEPLVWRETKTAEAFGRELTGARICWAPGAKTTSEITIRIGPYGIWEKP